MPIKKYVKDLIPEQDWIHDWRDFEEPYLRLEQVRSVTEVVTDNVNYRSVSILVPNGNWDWNPVHIGTVDAYKEVEVWTKDEVDDYYESYFEDFLYPNGDGDY